MGSIGGLSCLATGVMMYFAISCDLVCQLDITDRYSTKGSFIEPNFEGDLEECSSSVVAVSADDDAVSINGMVPVHVWTAQNGSLLRYSVMNSPISVSRACSEPSIATTAPRIAGVGLAIPGARSGGAIFCNTLILFMNGIVMIIAATPRA